MRTLESITVKGYKSIRDLSGEDGQGFELGDLNVLIGANGAGKSNFLSVFKLLNSIAARRLKLYVRLSDGADALLFFGRKNTKEIEIRLGLKLNTLDLFDYAFSLIPTAENNLIFFDEKCRHRLREEMNLDWSDIGGGNEETNLSSFWWQSSIPNILQNWKIYHFQDTTPEAKIKQNPSIHDNHELKPDAANLPPFLYLLKNHYLPFYHRILSTVQLVAPFIEDFVLEPKTAQSVRLKWRHNNSVEDFDISQLSDGTLRFICLATLLLQPNPPSLIIIDEPELGLHPAAIELLVEMLRSAAVKSQIIISTQSVEMVRQFSPEEIIVVDRKNDESVFTRKSSQELAMWLDEYNMGELWEMNVIGGRP